MKFFWFVIILYVILTGLIHAEGYTLPAAMLVGGFATAVVGGLSSFGLWLFGKREPL